MESSKELETRKTKAVLVANSNQSYKSSGRHGVRQKLLQWTGSGGSPMPHEGQRGHCTRHDDWKLQHALLESNI